MNRREFLQQSIAMATGAIAADRIRPSIDLATLNVMIAPVCPPCVVDVATHSSGEWTWTHTGWDRIGKYLPPVDGGWAFKQGNVQIYLRRSGSSDSLYSVIEAFVIFDDEPRAISFVPQPSGPPRIDGREYGC